MEKSRPRVKAQARTEGAGRATSAGSDICQEIPSCCEEGATQVSPVDVSSVNDMVASLGDLMAEVTDHEDLLRQAWSTAHRCFDELDRARTTLQPWPVAMDSAAGVEQQKSPVRKLGEALQASPHGGK